MFAGVTVTHCADPFLEQLMGAGQDVIGSSSSSSSSSSTSSSSSAAPSPTSAIGTAQSRATHVVRALLHNFVRQMEAPAATATVLAHYIGSQPPKDKPTDEGTCFVEGQFRLVWPVFVGLGRGWAWLGGFGGLASSGCVVKSTVLGL